MEQMMTKKMYHKNNISIMRKIILTTLIIVSSINVLAIFDVFGSRFESLNEFSTDFEKTGLWIESEENQASIGNFVNGEKNGIWFSLSNNLKLINISIYKFDSIVSCINTNTNHFRSNAKIYSSSNWKNSNFDSTDISSILLFEEGISMNIINENHRQLIEFKISDDTVEHYFVFKSTDDPNATIQLFSVFSLNNNFLNGEVCCFNSKGKLIGVVPFVDGIMHGKGWCSIEVSHKKESFEFVNGRLLSYRKTKNRIKGNGCFELSKRDTYFYTKWVSSSLMKPFLGDSVKLMPSCLKGVFGGSGTWKKYRKSHISWYDIAIGKHRKL
jgi:antitoxin component YwqK of YwqJK toxin-antitoxin module